MAKRPTTKKATKKAAAPKTNEEGSAKSIINPKYKGKYKRGTGSPTARFIESQCVDDDNNLDFDNFFELCRKNGIAEEKVTHYEKQLKSNAAGAAGRARMTLGNMLASVARKEQTLVDLKGKRRTVEQPQLAASGAAAKGKKAA